MIHTNREMSQSLDTGRGRVATYERPVPDLGKATTGMVAEATVAVATRNELS